ncbi:MAG: lipase family protein [Bacteroidota bacterium]
MKKLLTILLLAISILMTACYSLKLSIVQKETKYKISISYPSFHPDSIVRGKLMGYEKVETITSEDVKLLNPNHETDQYARNDIEVYRIYYGSLYNKKQKVVLSGLIAFPKSDRPLIFYQYHHGTLLPFPYEMGMGATDAPSLFKFEKKYHKGAFDQVRALGILPASYGYFVSMPDYAGYSISRDLEHPYNVGSELAESSIDMIFAARIFAQKMGIKTSKEVYLTGWSEGAGAAYHVLKLIEQDYNKVIVPGAITILAGAYTMTDLTTYISLQKKCEEAEIYNWTLYSYLKFSEVDISGLSIWKYPVGNQTEAIVTPSKKPKDIFQPEFLKALNFNFPDDSLSQKYLPVRKLFSSDNICCNWIPETPVYLHTGDKDGIVPDFNSRVAYKFLTEKNAKTRLHIYKGDDHFTVVPKYFVNLVKEIDSCNIAFTKK